MKAITIKQPWAWLIAQGIKDIENRTWATKYRGPILIHAGKSPAGGSNRSAVETAREVCRAHAAPGTETLIPEVFDYGGIIGVALLTDCVDHYPSPWFSGPYGFVLESARALPFVPCKGALSLWEADLEALGLTNPAVFASVPELTDGRPHPRQN